MQKNSLDQFFTKKKKRVELTNKSETKSLSTIKKSNSKSEQELSNEAESKLRQFDMDFKYGPCKGITRSQRYENACNFGFIPPKEIKSLIDQFGLNTSYFDNFK
jgi:DNA polymerase delta subunit 4